MREINYEIIMNRVTAYIDGRLYPLVKKVGELDEFDIVEYHTLMDLYRFIQDNINEQREEMGWQKNDIIG